MGEKMASTDIKWFRFDNINAPVLSNTWGCIIDVLDACLVTGFGSQTISSLVIENGVATATFSTAHNINQFQVVSISGATESALNKEYRVLGVTINTIEFAVDLPDQTASGTISCKLAPLGWTKAFSGTQKAVYQAKDTDSNPYFLRVDNACDLVYNESYAKFAKTGILETCDGIDDLTGVQAPYNTANPDKNWVGTGSGNSAISGWSKWYNAVINMAATTAGAYESHGASEGNREWYLIGNEDTFYFLPNLSFGAGQMHILLYGFGVVNNPFTGNNLPFLSTCIKDTAAGSALNLSTALGNLAQLVMLKDDSNNHANTLFGTVKLPFSATYSGNANYFAKTNSIPTLLGKYYMIDNLNQFVNEFPILVSTLYTTPELNDLEIFNHEGRALLKLTYRPARGVVGAVMFDLGEYY